MQRWGIAENDLPQGSEVRYRDQSLWRSYMWQITLFFLILLLQASLILGLLYERRQRHNAEVLARQRMADLAHANRFSIAGELTASIAHELNQPLGAILANAETVELMLNASAPDLNELKQILADICRDDRRAGEIVSHARSMLKKAPFELKRIDLNEIARDLHRIRHYGLFAKASCADNIARARELLAVATPHSEPADAAVDHSKPTCPCCGGRMIIIEVFERDATPRHQPAGPATVIRIDTS
jgi:signal transduction histidine kinase